jgi:hypothetical protein
MYKHICRGCTPAMPRAPAGARLPGLLGVAVGAGHGGRHGSDEHEAALARVTGLVDRSACAASAHNGRIERDQRLGATLR